MILACLSWSTKAVAIEPIELPTAFDGDFQFFAPMDIDPLDDKRTPTKSGFFASYGRAYTNVGRAKASGFGFDGDFTWGNVFDLGFHTPDGGQWATTITHTDGPNLGSFRRVAELDFDPDDAESDPTDPDFDPDFNQIQVLNSLNVADMTSVEVNRFWRWKSSPSGGTIEPFAGVRFINFTDFSQGTSVVTILPPVPDDLLDPNRQEISRARSAFENNMLGGQLGVRLTKRRGRWFMRGDWRGFVLQNWQGFGSRSDLTVVAYDGPQLADELRRDSTIVDLGQSDAEFVMGTQFGGDLSYYVTRDIAFNFGFNIMLFGRGIGRGIIPGLNDESLFIGGIKMGIVANR